MSEGDVEGLDESKRVHFHRETMTELKNEIEMKQISKGIDNVAFQEDNDDRSILICNKNNPPSKSIDQEDDTSVCTKCQVETAIPNVPILSNDRPYTIEVFDCASQDKVEVLRINISKKGEKTPRIEMSPRKNQVFPLNETSAIVSSELKPTKQYTKEDEIQVDKVVEEITEKVFEEEGEERQQWSNPIEFLLSCIAMSVGLGNVWRFPFTAYENGGGAFLIPYMIILIFIGRPLYFLELAMGQFSSKSSVNVWDLSPIFRGVGYGQAIATSSVVSYYTVLIALAVFYLVASCQSTLPWTVCDLDLQMDNDTVCIDANMNASMVANGTKKVGSAEQYFLRNVLKEIDDISDGIGMPDWKLTICLAVCYLLLFLTLWKGVASSGKVAYFTAIFPYVVLFTLLGRGVTLPGAMDGIMFYITPKWEELLNIKVWYAAVTQSFFSLSVGFGALFSYSSYNGFRHNVYRDALIISLFDTGTSLLAGFTIFSVLGNLAYELGEPVDQVIKSGTGLAFISYPMAIAKFDWFPQIFAVLFFLMLITLGLGSATGLTSAVIAIIADNKPEWNKTYVTLGVCICGFLIGTVYLTPGGQFILNLVDFFGGGFMIFALTVLEVVGIIYVYGFKRVLEDIKFMLGIELGIYWKFCWGFLVPVALSFFFFYYTFTFEQITYAGNSYPDVVIYAGYGLLGLAVIQVPIWAIYELFRVPKPSLGGKLKGVFKPTDNWGPKNPRIKAEWMKEVIRREVDEVLK